jgi:hypothetical protein
MATIVRRKLSRILPQADPRHYRTFKVIAPLASHWKRATCEEYMCQDYTHGWATTVDTSTELGQKQFYFITHDKERKYSYQKLSATLHVFVYDSGQRPFFDEGKHTHFMPVGREPYYLVHDGDWRGNPTGNKLVHRNHQDWVDQFGENQNRLIDLQKRG